ncbi:NAD(P) transhydrogenase subunit alpha [Rubrobacter taiwanensis]|jgi:NAD(P) transhydrogenase subunit alpha|uniref:proton-translocating NAD(P)(+) transhydrogenase n=1 Tax=Rubrobacter taiwanensis TaxID=185139 RepID=A0A4R1BR90_9ACTN|nr:NAD(P) transhydrogenase subunit alpha [Rubrobacter taiwanensis]TCJ19705.1 NAD(P) transhydrogenase subunit alpha [Rubrobacter taiwanensis]
MDQQLLLEIIIFVLAAVIGFELISRVPSLLHTPLMSATNAIHGIILVGALLVLGASESLLTTVLGMIAVIFATINVVGGFVVTNRMLEMFKREPQKKRRVRRVRRRV